MTRHRWPVALGAVLAALALTLGVGLTTSPEAPPVAPQAVAAAPSVPVAAPPVAVRPEAPRAPRAPRALGRSAPVRVQVPSIGSDSRRGGPVQRVGLQPDRSIEVPPVDEPQRAGWYRHAPTPGQPGTAVVLGHVNGGGQDGVYARLSQVRAGALVLVDRADGARAVFRAYRVETVDKDAFPSKRVYAQAKRPELRLITCGGRFVGGAQGYGSNVVVFAALDHVERAP